MKVKLSLSLALIFLALPMQKLFPETSITQIEIILDASRSMRQKIKGVPKINIARDALIKLADELKLNNNIHVGLRIFGHKNKRCNNTILEIPIGRDSIEKIKSRVKNVVPIGNTPIAYSLFKSAADFNKNIPGKKIVIIITDGNENCKDNPCKVALKLKREGIVSKIHIVAFGFKKQSYLPLKCIVKPSRGVILRADNLKELDAGLKKIISIDSPVRNVKEEVLKNNLIVTGKGISDKRIQIVVEVYRGNEKVKQNKGEIVNFHLEDGVYSIKIIAPHTKQEIDINNLKILKNKLIKKSVKFNRVMLKMRITDKNDKVIDSEVFIYKAGTKSIVIRKKRVELITDNLILFPGIYDLKIIDLATGAEKFIYGLNVNENVVEKKLDFKRGVLTIRGKYPSGSDKTVAVTVYKSGTENIVLKYGGAKVHKLTLFPGTYDIKVNDWYGTGEKWIMKQSIKNGTKIKKDIVIKDE